MEEAEKKQLGYEFILQSLNAEIIISLLRNIRSNLSCETTSNSSNIKNHIDNIEHIVLAFLPKLYQRVYCRWFQKLLTMFLLLLYNFSFAVK